MGLFVFAMCLLVLANNFLVLVAGWEGGGLCSYLLVGYYYAKPSAAAAPSGTDSRLPSASHASGGWIEVSGSAESAMLGFMGS